MVRNFDAIIIGGGPGGSTIAGLLASKGKRVLLVDKNSYAGGRMTQLKQLGHTYEPFPLNMMPFAPSLFEKLAEETGKTDKIRNVAKDSGDKVNIIYGTRDGKKLLFDMSDPKTLLKAGINPLQMPKIKKFFEKMLALNTEEVQGLEHISAFDYIAQQKLPEALAVYVTAAMGEGAFEMSSDKVPASHLVRFAQMIMLDKTKIQRYYEGGIGGFFNTIIETVEENGGKKLMETRVKSIDVENGKAVGITTDDGEKYTAPIVISSAGIRQTVHRLVGAEHFDTEYAQWVKNLQSNLADVGYRYFTTKPVLEHSTYVYFPYNCLETWDEFDEMAQGKRKPTGNYIYMGSKSVFPTVSPEGKQIIYACMSCHPDPEQDFQPYLDYVEKHMKEIFPVLFEDGVIEKREIMTLDEVSVYGTERIFPRQGGESYGVANAIGQTDSDGAKCKTPLSGLYIVGNDAEGFGVGCHRAVDSGFKLFGHLKEDGFVS